MTDNSDLSGQNVVSFPEHRRPFSLGQALDDRKSATPKSDEILAKARELDLLSTYNCTFDYNLYRNLELRYADKVIRGGIVMKTAFRLVNSHSTCQQCLYAFEIDTYGRGCIHDCTYCYAKAELTVHGYWNNPVPAPVDINEIRKAFYLTFETSKKHKWSEVLARRIPLRIGSMSDSFMWTDKKYGVTRELLKILNHYQYPYIIFTRSDLIAEDEYMSLLNKNLASIQFSLSSTNEKLTRLIEPGAPSPKRRLRALKKLSEEKFWTTVRLNPFFPIFPDGYFSDPNFSWKGAVPKFDFSSFEMIDEVADHAVPAVLAGFVRLSSFSINKIEKSAGINLRQFYNREAVLKSARDWHFSDREIRSYYERLKQRAISKGMEFTTCYIGNGESHFWKDQDLWSNKKDCCNVKDRVSSFVRDSREVAFENRLKFTHQKNLKPESQFLYHPLGSMPEVERSL